MFSARHLVCLALVLSVAGPAFAQTVDLTEGPQVDRFFHIDTSMRLDGNFRVRQDGKVVEQPMVMEARHEYVEKILKITDGVVDRSVRLYQTAWAQAKGGARLAFRPNRTFMVVQRSNGQTVAYCPDGILTNDELKLTEHFNSMALSGLLPGKQVSVGDSWPVPRAAAQSLFAVEGLVDNDLSCKLESVKDNLAQIRVAGSVNGIDLGAEVKINIQEAWCTFDVRQKRIVALDWKQNDQRESGPVSPALSATVSIDVRRSVATDPPRELGDLIVSGKVPQGAVPANDLQIAYAIPDRRFEIQCSRDWIMTAQSREHSVWRLMNRGDLVAQVTVTPWKKLPAGSMVSAKDFLEVVRDTANWKETATTPDTPQTSELKDLPAGNRALCHAAPGKLDGIDVMQYFYVLAGSNGDHVLVTFTLSPEQDRELPQHGLTFIRGISFP